MENAPFLRGKFIEDNDLDEKDLDVLGRRKKEEKGITYEALSRQPMRLDV
jgi:hypothetical protein